MKYLITERQLKLIKEDKIRKIDFEIFNNDWDLLQKFLERRGNPPYIIIGNLNLNRTNIETLGSLVGVEGGYLDLSNNKTIKDLGSLEFVKGSLYIQNTNIESLGNLKSVGENLRMINSIVESLGNLETVGEGLYMKNSYVLTLSNLKSVGGNLDCRNNVLESLGNLESVGGYLFVEDTNIDSLGNLKFVGDDFDLRFTPLSRKTTEEEIRAQVTVGDWIDM